ncbi:MAG: transglycosylase SLT domain-containing protein [Cocleimonas sp.]
MINTTPFKVILAVATTIVLTLGFTASSFAQTSSEASLVDAARALGLTPKIVETPTRTLPNNAQTNIKRQAPQQTLQKFDPYAAKRQQILRQNAQRRKAHQQRLAHIQKNLQRRQHQQAQAQVTRQQNGHRNVWNRVYQGFQFRDHSKRPVVQKYANQFSRSPVRIQRLADRSADYLYMVVNELNRRRMPTELALLPFVESAYRNNAYSHAGAAGMWQFIPATGRHYGLKQTRSYDARLDSYQATHAAFDYLQKLHREFKGDWFLALAAYNAGEYRVQKEINKNRRLGKRTDYWSLDLPKETRQYVPRLLAYKEIFRNPRAYRVHLRGIPNSPALARIHVNKAVDLRKAAAHAGVPSDKLLAMNSGFLHGITTPRFSNQITLPRRHAGALNRAIQQLPPAADVHNKRSRYAKYSGKKRRYVYHKVRSGDNLYRIARKHGTTVKKIKRLNKMRGNRIWPGKRLKIAKGRSSRKSYS